MLFFGFLSALLGLIRFGVPGVESVYGDFREVPALLSVLYLSNPYYTIGISLISSLTIPGDTSYISSVVMHSVSLFISWYVYQYIVKLKLKTLLSGLFWLLYVIPFYLLLLIPILIGTDYLLGRLEHLDLMNYYSEIISELWYEIVFTATVTTISFIQFLTQKELRNHQGNLEVIIKHRTEELRSTIEQLKETRYQLIQSEKMASMHTLTAGVAHELNNPLNYISGGLFLLESIQKKSENFLDASTEQRFKKSTEAIKEGLARSTKIVKALMTFSGKNANEQMTVNLNKIIDNTLLFMNKMIPEDITISKSYELQKEIPVFTEEVHQIIINLIENALFALNSVKGKQKLIRISTIEKNSRAQIKIENNGESIKTSDLTQIFDPFFTTKAPGEGTGLGLSICYTYMKGHKGDISVYNTEQGVCFELEFPVRGLKHSIE